MYRAATMTVLALKGQYSKDRSDPSPKLSKGTTASGDYRVTYTNSPRLDAAIEHYLNEHVPATWRLVSVCISGEDVTFIWSVDE